MWSSAMAGGHPSAAKLASQGAGRALALFVLMQSQGIAADLITYGAAISACEKGKQSDLALGLLE